MQKVKTNKQSRLILTVQILFFVLVYALLFYFLRDKIRDLPQILTATEQIYGSYGYYLIFMGALIEGIFILGFYIPGSLVVYLGASLARLGIISFPLVVLFGTLGFSLGYSINYCLGRFGWYRILEGIGFEEQIAKTKIKLKQHYNQALFFGYIMPSTGALISTSSGILKVPFRQFIIKTIIIQLHWSLLLGGLAYLFGMTFINVFLLYFGPILIFGFIIYQIVRYFKKRKRTPSHAA